MLINANRAIIKGKTNKDYYETILKVLAHVFTLTK